MTRMRWLVVGCAAVLASCSGVNEPLSGNFGEPGLTTDASEYTAHVIDDGFGPSRYSFQVIARFHNATSSTIYLARCYPDTPYPIYGVSAVGEPPSAGGAAYDPVWACVGHDRQIAVPAGSTRTDTLTIAGPNAFDGITHVGIGRTEGRFRTGV